MLDLKLLQELDAYIEENYIPDNMDMCCDSMLASDRITQRKEADKYLCCVPNWSEFIPEPDPDTFSSKLFRIIDRKGLNDVDVYKKANIDRKLFSKLRKKNYHPSKKTAIALALSLELNLDEAKDLLSYAEYALSPHELCDIIIEFCFKNSLYDIMEVNELLYKRSRTTL